jgi:hypothetical protein
MRKYLLLISTYLLISNTFGQQHTDNWKFFKESNDISVYFRTHEKSTVKELKLTTKINATVQSVESIITNVDILKTWGYACLESKLLKRKGMGELYYYYAVDVPWPLSDRDVVINMKIRQDSLSGITDINSMNFNGLIPEKEDRTRLKYVKAHWQLIPINKNSMQLDFTIATELGSDFPDWLVNYAMSYSPIKSITALRNMAEK